MSEKHGGCFDSHCTRRRYLKETRKSSFEFVSSRVLDTTGRLQVDSVYFSNTMEEV